MKKLILFCIGFMVSLSAEMSSNKPWAILFLDIDGVLFRESPWDDLDDPKRAKLQELFGSLSDYYSFHWDCATAYFLNPAAVALLEDFIDQTNIQYNVGIVLSSSWREGKTLAEIRQIFSPWRFSQFIIDKTVDSDCFYKVSNWPSLDSMAKYGFPTYSRAEQVEYWLREHENLPIRQFIILDDIDFDFSKKFPAHFVHVRGGMLTLLDIHAASLLLTEKSISDTLFSRHPCQNYP